MSSSDSNARDVLWEHHYRAASRRRRARGWHRHDEASRTRGRKNLRLKIYIGAATLFVLLTIVALLLPH